MGLVGDYVSFQNGYAFKANAFSASGDYRVVKIKELKDGGVKFTDNTSCVNYFDGIDKYIVRDGDVLFALTGDPVSKTNPLSWVGRVSLYKEKDYAVLNQRVCKLIPGEEVNPLFLYYYFRNNSVFYDLAGKATGSASQANISVSTIAGTEIDLPCLDIQNRIVGVLSSLDEKMRINNLLNQNLEEQLHALFDAFFTDLYFCKTTTVKQSDFGDIPSSWKVLPLGEANLDISDGNYSSKYPKQDEFLDSGIPFIRGTDFNGVSISRESMYYISSQKHEELKKGHTKRGDILITTRGDIGRIAFVPDSLVDVNINSQLVRINGSSIVPRSYLGCFLTSQRVQNDIHSLVSGSALQQLPIGKLKKVLFLMPDQDMLKRFDSIAEPFYLRMFANDEENIRLTSVRNTLLPRLMSGELDVSEIEI